MDRIQKLLEAVDRWADYTIELRRQIHENPEQIGRASCRERVF